MGNDIILSNRIRNSKRRLAPVGVSLPARLDKTPIIPFRQSRLKGCAFGATTLPTSAPHLPQNRMPWEISVLQPGQYLSFMMLSLLLASCPSTIHHRRHSKQGQLKNHPGCFLNRFFSRLPSTASCRDGQAHALGSRVANPELVAFRRAAHEDDEDDVGAPASADPAKPPGLLSWGALK
jgi:hypothetical protein